MCVVTARGGERCTRCRRGGDAEAAKANWQVDPTAIRIMRGYRSSPDAHCLFGGGQKTGAAQAVRAAALAAEERRAVEEERRLGGALVGAGGGLAGGLAGEIELTRGRVELVEHDDSLPFVSLRGEYAAFWGKPRFYPEQSTAIRKMEAGCSG